MMKVVGGAILSFCVWSAGGTVGCVLAALIFYVSAMYKKTEKRVIALEGNIGSGKTTMLKLIGHGKQENIEKWGPYLEWHKMEPGKVLATQLLILTEYTKRPTEKLYERSWCSAVMFAFENLKDQDPKYFDAYLDHVKCLVNRGILLPPQSVLFLESSPATCLSRLKSRNGPGDSAFTIKMLQTLEEAHATLLDFYGMTHVPVVLIGDNPGDDYNVAQNITSPRVGPTTIIEALDACWKISRKYE